MANGVGDKASNGTDRQTLTLDLTLYLIDAPGEPSLWRECEGTLQRRHAV